MVKWLGIAVCCYGMIPETVKDKHSSLGDENEDTENTKADPPQTLRGYVGVGISVDKRQGQGWSVRQWGLVMHLASRGNEGLFDAKVKPERLVACLCAAGNPS